MNFENLGIPQKVDSGKWFPHFMGFSTKVVPEQCGFHIVRCFLPPKISTNGGPPVYFFYLSNILKEKKFKLICFDMFFHNQKVLERTKFFFLSIHIWNELKNWRFWWVYLKHDISTFIFKNMSKAWTDLSKNLSIFKFVKLFIYKYTQVFLRHSFRIDLHAWKAIKICRFFHT